MDSFLSQLLQGLAAIGGLGIIVAGLATWVGQRIAERLTLNWRQEQEKELERLRADIGRSQAILNSAINAFSTVHQSSQQRRVIAVEGMWKCIIDLRTHVWPVLFVHQSVFEDSDYRPSTSQIDSILRGHSRDNVDSKAVAISAAVEADRPFLGENLWGLFLAYRSIVLRMSLKVFDRMSGKAIEPWLGDDETYRLLEKVLTSDEILSCKLGKSPGLTEAVGMLEQKIVLHSICVISGKEALDENLSQAKRLIQEVRNMERHEDFSRMAEGNTEHLPHPSTD